MILEVGTINGFDLLRAVGRNVAVFVICLILTVAASAAVFLSVRVPYKAETLLVLLAPAVVTNDVGQTAAQNPWQVAGAGPAQVTASALASIAESEPFLNQLEEQGVTGTTDVLVSTSGGGVVLDVSSVNNDGKAAGTDLTKLIAALQVELEKRQASVGAPGDSFLRLTDLTSGSSPSLQTGDRTKLTGVAGVLGLLVTVVAVAVADTFKRRKRQPASFDASAEPPNGERLDETDLREATGRPVPIERPLPMERPERAEAGARSARPNTRPTAKRTHRRVVKNPGRLVELAANGSPDDHDFAATDAYERAGTQPVVARAAARTNLR